MKKLIASAVFVALTGAIPAPCTAQAFDWLTPHLDAQRFGDQLRANQRRRTAGKGKSKRQYSRRRNATMHKAPERYPQVKINGQPLRSSVAAVEVNGRAFVPFRDIFEALGATVNYDAQDRLITARRGTSIMQLGLPGGSTAKMSNKETFNRGETPFIRRGVTMVPLRMVSEKMGAQVNYVQRSKTPLISITAKTA